MLVISDYVGCAHPFVGGGTRGVGDVVAFFILEAQKAADVVENSDIVRSVNYETLLVMTSRHIFCGVDEVVV